MVRRRREFTVKDLIKLLEKCDPDAIPVMPGRDHSYDRITRAYETDAESTEDQQLFEYHGAAHMFSGSDVTNVVVIEM